MRVQQRTESREQRVADAAVERRQEEKREKIMSVIRTGPKRGNSQ